MYQQFSEALTMVKKSSLSIYIYISPQNGYKNNFTFETTHLEPCVSSTGM